MVKLGIVIDMLSIYETYCDLTIGKRNVFIRYFNEPGETRSANRLSLDGAVIAEIDILFKTIIIIIIAEMVVFNVAGNLK